MSQARNTKQSILETPGIYATTRALSALTGVPEPVVNELAKRLEVKQAEPPKGLIHLRLFNKHLKRFAKERWYEQRGQEGPPPCPGGVLPVEGL